MISLKRDFRFKEIKYLELFRLFCIVGESINTSNQIRILNYFIKALRRNESTMLYQITFSKKGEEIETEAAADKNQSKKRKFDDYYKLCKN